MPSLHSRVCVRFIKFQCLLSLVLFIPFKSGDFYKSERLGKCGGVSIRDLLKIEK